MSPGEPLRLQAHSPTLPTLFETLALQLFSRIVNPQEVGAAIREKVVAEGESLELLLCEWITALLDLVRVQRMIFSQIRILRLETPEKGPYILQAEAVGELLDPHRHTLSQDPAWLKCRHPLLQKDASGYHAELEI